MTLNQLRYFCTTCRFRNITQAANELYVTQPTISLAIKELEEELGVILFTRIGNKLTITSDGAHLYERAKYILDYCNDLQLEISTNSEKNHPLHIGIPPMLSMIFFPSLSDAYNEMYPDSHIILDELGSIRACQMVQNDELDLALVNMETYNIDQLDSVLLLTDQLVFCVTSNHALAGKDTIVPDDLANEDIILLSRDSVQNKLIRSRFETHGICPNIIMQANQLYTIINYIRDGKRGCFLFEKMLAGLPKYKGIPLSPPLTVRIGLVWKKGRFIRSDMQQFISFAKKYYKL